MNRYSDNCLDINIAYIGGGSRGWAWGLMGDLALEKELGGHIRLYDIDAEAAKTNEIIGNRIMAASDAPNRWTYTAVPTLEEALRDAQFVIISILPGSFDEMEIDVNVPQAYGIYQSVGDTVGPGGILRTMRTVPMYVEFARAIEKVCPDAWVISYTNPMCACVGTLYRVFPNIKAFGCCHEVFSTQELFAKLLETECGIEGIARQDIHLNVQGINHFTWVNEATWQNTDLLPLYKDAAEKYGETGYAVSAEDDDKNNHFRNKHKVAFDLYRHYGLIPAAGDRHISEFMPPWYLDSKDPEPRWGFDLTPISFRKEERDELIRLSGQYASGEKSFVPAPSGEEGVRQIRALCGLETFVTNVILPNVGQMDGLPLGSVVETNALFSKNSIKPVFAGRLPEQVNAIVLRHAVNQTNIVTAGIKKDIQLAFHVFLNDNLVNLPLAEAKSLFREMANGTAKYLAGWDLEKIK